MAHVIIFPMLNIFYIYIRTSRSMCAVLNMAVVCSALILCFPGMLHRYFLNDVQTVPVAHTITGINFVFTFHTRCISIVRSLHFRIISISSLITFLSPDTATYCNIYVPFSLPRIMVTVCEVFSLR